MPVAKSKQAPDATAKPKTSKSTAASAKPATKAAAPAAVKKPAATKAQAAASKKDSDMATLSQAELKAMADALLAEATPKRGKKKADADGATPAKKPAAKKAAAPKKQAVVAEEVVEEKKPAAKKETVKKETKKAAPAKAEAKKPVAKKTELKSEISVQFGGKSYSQEELLKIAKDVWKYDLKQKAADLTSVELYVKPEENMVYYVMNKETTGSFYI